MLNLGPTLKIASLLRRLMRLKVRMDGFEEGPTGYNGPFEDVCRFRPVRVDADLLRCCGEPRVFIGKQPLGA